MREIVPALREGSNFNAKVLIGGGIGELCANLICFHEDLFRTEVRSRGNVSVKLLSRMFLTFLDFVFVFLPEKI